MPDAGHISPWANSFLLMSTAGPVSKISEYMRYYEMSTVITIMHGPAGRRPCILAHNLQMTALKLDHKHSNIASWYNPGKGKQITYTYAHMVVEAQEKNAQAYSSNLNLHGGKSTWTILIWKGCVRCSWWQGTNPMVFRLSLGVFMDILPFMTLLQCGDTDVLLAKEERGVYREGSLDQTLHPWHVARNPVSRTETSWQFNGFQFFPSTFLFWKFRIVGELYSLDTQLNQLSNWCTGEYNPYTHKLTQRVLSESVQLLIHVATNDL